MIRNRTPHVLRKALGAVGLVLALASAQGCVVAARGQLRTSGTYAYEAPPPPRQEAHQSRSGHVWVSGRWDWQNGGWQWMAGHWERERAGYNYQEGRWAQENNQWRYNEGAWVVVNGGATTGHDHTYNDGRDQVRDHRDGQVGTYQPPPPPPPPNTGTVIIGGGGGISITGPGYAPPPRRTESYGAARSGYVWISGNWQWSNGNYEWVSGHWEREKAGYQWYDGEWRNQGSAWVWVEGGWRAPTAVQGTGTIRVQDRRTH